MRRQIQHEANESCFGYPGTELGGGCSHCHGADASPAAVHTGAISAGYHAIGAGYVCRDYQRSCREYECACTGRCRNPAECCSSRNHAEHEYAECVNPGPGVGYSRGKRGERAIGRAGCSFGARSSRWASAVTQSGAVLAVLERRDHRRRRLLPRPVVTHALRQAGGISPPARGSAPSAGSVRAAL
jgi:hypothetical protein